MLLLTLAATLFAAPATLADPDLNAAIHKAGKKAEPIVTPADRALIEAKCGTGAYDQESTNINKGVLICPDGRRIDDAETHAMSKRIEVRAKAYVDSVMNDPAVKRAMDGTIEREVAAALRKVRRQLRD
jgi:hypothetical protein